jgi:TolB-like protein
MPFAQASYSPSSKYFTDSFADKNLDALHHFEVLFIVFAAAFALEEYTTSIEHGWGSKCNITTYSLLPLIKRPVYIANVGSR